MKTTVEIPDPLYRQIKARAALKGQTVRAYLTDALKDKIKSEAKNRNKKPGWLKLAGGLPDKAVREIQDIIDEEFSKIDPVEWK